MARKMSEPQRILLEHLVDAGGELLDNYFSCYLGYRAVISAALRRGWVERPSWQPDEGLVIADAGRKALQEEVPHGDQG